MNIVQASQSRYSTKAFDASRKLSEQQVADLKELVRMSASSVNSQPWHFILASTVMKAKHALPKLRRAVFRLMSAKF